MAELKGYARRLAVMQTSLWRGVLRRWSARPLEVCEETTRGRADQPMTFKVAAQVKHARKPLVGRRTCSLGGAG